MNAAINILQINADNLRHNADVIAREGNLDEADVLAADITEIEEAITLLNIYTEDEP